MILVFAGLYLAAALAFGVVRAMKNTASWSAIGHATQFHLFGVTLAGVMAGLVINPYFPQNLTFYWHQLVKIGIINYQHVISVGNEWYPYKFIDLTGGSALLTMLLVAAIGLICVYWRRLSQKTLTLFFIFFLFLAFTLKSRRYVEYYVPFAVLFSAFALNDIWRMFGYPAIWDKVKALFRRQKILFTAVILYFIVFIPLVAAKDMRQTYRDLRGGNSALRFAASSRWLKENTPAKSVVFHSSWDEFPLLFYHNSHNYYIAGLDPTFTYEYSPEAYRKMVDITIGKQTEGIFQDLREVFGASYVFVEKKHTAMDKNIKNSSGFMAVYSDNEATIYKLIIPE